MNEADFGPNPIIKETKAIAANGNLQSYLNGIKSTPGNYVINLNGNPTAFTTTDGVSLSSGVNVSLRGAKTVSVGTATSLFEVQTGAELIIRGVTLQGKANSSYALVRVYGGLILHTGTITGHENGSGNGGGVWIDNGGTFTMNGGEISSNYSYGSGGGVWVDDGATFTWNAGTFTNNTAASDGQQIHKNTSGVVSGSAVTTVSGGTNDGSNAAWWN
ncbi:hypothetical protein FACS189487_03420 [Campylobacterota bacterium]|nr:hypothetical protein FACS189487_03420 [Campylobacterota bacterium]